MYKKWLLALALCLSLSAQGLTAFASDSEIPEEDIMQATEVTEEENTPELEIENAENTVESTAEAPAETIVANTELSVRNTPSQTEIESFIKNHPFNFTKEPEFEENPVINVTNPKAGKIKDSDLTNALNCLNTYRYIGGLNANTVLNADYSNTVQTGTTLLAVNGSTITHTPEKPLGMPDNFYQLGYNGTSHSNLSYGSIINIAAHVRNCIEDSDARNLSVVGHRRWVLQESLPETGFGFTDNGGFNRYFATYVAGQTQSLETITTWPAANTPINLIRTQNGNYPWSIHFSYDSEYQMDNVVLTLTNNRTGKSTTLKATNNLSTGFNFSKQYVGGSYAITFVPTQSAPGIVSDMKDGDSYSVSLIGITKAKDKKEQTYSISYDVNLFQLSDEVKEIITPADSQKPSYGSSTMTIYTNPDGSTTYETTYNDGRVTLRTVDKNGNEIPTPEKYGQAAWDEYLANQGQGTGSNSDTSSDTGSGGSNTQAPTTKPEKPAMQGANRIALTASITKLAPKKSTVIMATVGPENATNKTISWSVNNTKYASINQSGKLTAKVAGAGKTVTVTAKATSGKSAAIKIKIMKGAVKSIKLSGRKSVKAGKSTTIKAKIAVTKKSANKTLIWSVKNDKYASITSKGKLTAKKAGKGKTVTVTAKATDGTGKTATFKVKIK